MRHMTMAMNAWGFSWHLSATRHWNVHSNKNKVQYKCAVHGRPSMFVLSQADVRGAVETCEMCAWFCVRARSTLSIHERTDKPLDKTKAERKDTTKRLLLIG